MLKSSGFTLVELLVTIAVIAILASLGLPALARGIEASHRSKCANNLRQIHVTLGFYAADNNNRLPPSVPRKADGISIANFAYYSLLPYLPYKKDVELTVWGGNKSGNGIFCCPALRKQVGFERATASNNYALNAIIWTSVNRLNAVGIPQSNEAAEGLEVPLVAITHPSRTILAGDANWRPTASPPQPLALIDFNMSAGIPRGVPAPAIPTHSNGGANLLFCDGHVEYWPNSAVLLKTENPRYSDNGSEDLWNPIKSK